MLQSPELDRTRGGSLSRPVPRREPGNEIESGNGIFPRGGSLSRPVPRREPGNEIELEAGASAGPFPGGSPGTRSKVT